MKLSAILPPFIPLWLKYYTKNRLNQDVIAGLIVGILVIPQSLGYAVLAGLSPVYGLYSAIVPVVVYAWVGSSSVNAVGPVAITAIMTAQILHNYHYLPASQYASMATLLALLTGVIWWLASLLKLGWITQFISRGVTAGFISGACVLVFINQLKFLTGIPITGNTLFANLSSLYQYINTLHVPTLCLGLSCFVLLWFNRYYLKPYFLPKCHGNLATVISFFNKVLPLLVVMLSIGLAQWLDFAKLGIRVIDTIPQHLPVFTPPLLPSSLSEIVNLLPSAGLMALVGFVSSNAIANSFARQRQEPFSANHELQGLGLSNIIGAFFQSFTVVGGLSRTAVNVEAGAVSPLANLISVLVMVATIVLFTDWLTPLPYAVLGAIIMVSILAMIDFGTFKTAYQSDKLDALAFLVCFLGVLIFGLNIGLVTGLLFSFAGLIWQSSHPHIAIVGQIGNTGHFRNIQRHQVTQHQHLLIIRIDESLFYGNAQSVQQFIENALNDRPETRHLVIMLSAVNRIDLTAQEMLINLNHTLQQQAITLHFSEIKGPVMDILEKTPVIQQLSGKVFLSTQQAVVQLT